MEKNPLLEKAECPGCGKLLDAATAVEEEGAQPSPGDFTVCFYCSSILMYNPDYSLKELSEIDINNLELGIRVSLLKAQKSVREYHLKKL